MCCAICAALFVLPCSAFCQQKKPVVYKGIVPIDQAMFSDGKLCVPLVVAMTAGDFFSGLKADQTPAGRRFYKHAKQVTQFPEQTTIFVRASMLSCSLFPYVPVKSEDAEDFMHHLNFTLEWHSEVEQKPVEAVTSKLIAPGPPVWPENQKPIPVWSYIFTVNTRGVPLTDDLIITLQSETGSVVSRMGAHL